MKNRNQSQELGMSFADDPDSPSDHEWDLFDTLNEDADAESEEDEMETSMQHNCASCGQTNTILPPRGHRFVRKSKVEREFEKLDEAYAIGSTWRESYRRALQRPSCPLPM